MNRLLRLFCLIILLFASVSYAESNNTDEHIVWQRAPIHITLPVGKERFISFPNEVQFGYNTTLLPPPALRVENDNQTLYLLAKKPFDTQRVEAKLASGEIILLDINAKKQADSHPIDIVLPAIHQKTQSNNTNDISSSSTNYVELVRYAIQQLYAPQRLLKHSNSIRRFPMETSHVVPLFYDSSASAMPLASWRSGDFYVTALLIKNLLQQPLRLDPRLLCGNWKTASFYPKTTLSPRGTPINQDTSTLFVVSDQPFAQATRSCMN